MRAAARRAHLDLLSVAVCRRLPAGERNDAWRRVLRTGRMTVRRWEEAFGHAVGPVLDVGAGDSPWTREMRTRGWPAIALDPQYALRPPPGATPGTGRDVAGLAEALPFTDAIFGTVFVGHCLQHVADPVAGLRECLRVTRPDGRVLIHPVWASGSRLGRAAARPGVTVVPRRRRPRRRPGISLDPSVNHSDAALRDLARALVPALPVRLLGRAAMQVVIAVRDTTAVGPGAGR